MENPIDITASWPALNSLEKFKPRYMYYSWADLDFRKSLRSQGIFKERTDPFFGLSIDDIHVTGASFMTMRMLFLITHLLFQFHGRLHSMTE